MSSIYDYSAGTYDEWHSITSITLDELASVGFFSWDDESWNWKDYAYNDSTYTRLCNMFFEKYKWREIGILPPGIWKQQLLYTIKYELCPKYNPMYAIMEDFNPLQDSDVYEKRRDINSGFPETLLSGNSVYASSGTDSEHETVSESSYWDAFERYKTFKYVDEQFIDELEKFFSGIYTTNVNGW